MEIINFNLIKTERNTIIRCQLQTIIIRMKLFTKVYIYNKDDNIHK